MSLVPTSEALIAARRGGYAIGAFKLWNLESVRAVIARAERLSRPVILQVGPYEADDAELEVRCGGNLKWNTAKHSRC